MRKALRIVLWTFVLLALMAAAFAGGVVLTKMGFVLTKTGLVRVGPPAAVPPAVRVEPVVPSAPPAGASAGPVFTPERNSVLTVSGESGAIHAPERSVRIQGRVLGPVLAQSVLVERNGSVLGKITASESVVVEGDVAGDVEGATVILRPSAEVAGSVRATSHLAVETGASVSGKLTPPEGQSVRILPRPNRFQTAEPFPGQPQVPQQPQVIVRNNNGGWPWLAGFFGFIALGTMAFAFFGEEAAHVADTATQRPARYLTRGLLAALIAPPLIGLLGVTIVGIPLAVATGAIVAAAAAVGIAAIGLTVGRKVSVHLPAHWNVTPLMQVVLGAVLLILVVTIPVLGVLLVGLALLVGFGGVVDLWYPRLREAWRRWRQRPRPT